jgi:hypothetical protein
MAAQAEDVANRCTPLYSVLSVGHIFDMSDFLSSKPRDKLQAALNQNSPNSEYAAACRAWFLGLTSHQRKMCTLATIAGREGDESEGERIAGVLPSAPRYKSGELAAAATRNP